MFFRFKKKAKLYGNIHVNLKWNFNQQFYLKIDSVVAIQAVWKVTTKEKRAEKLPFTNILKSVFQIAWKVRKTTYGYVKNNR